MCLFLELGWLQEQPPGMYLYSVMAQRRRKMPSHFVNWPQAKIFNEKCFIAHMETPQKTVILTYIIQDQFCR